MTEKINKISNNGLEMIKKSEQLRLHAYLCPAGKLTIGYGHVIDPIVDYVAFKAMNISLLQRLKNDCEKSNVLTKEAHAALFINPTQADAFLNNDVCKVARTIGRTVNVELNQNQFDALCSFIFNIGGTAFYNSTMRKKLNKGDYEGAANEFKRWNKATVNGVKKVLNGLTVQRQSERKLFIQKVF